MQRKPLYRSSTEFMMDLLNMNSLRPSSEITNIYVYGEYEYAVLTNAAVNGGRSGQILCQILPKEWSLAPNGGTTQDVIRLKGWSAYYVSASDGNSYRTSYNHRSHYTGGVLKSCEGGIGAHRTISFLYDVGLGWYKSTQILIRRRKVEQCYECPPGKYQSSVSGCSDCIEGYYAPNDGMSSCLECGADKYSTVGQSGCFFLS